MLKTLQLTNFRGFEQLELKQLNRVNLIVGDNNTGKTSLLELLVLLLGGPEDLRRLPVAFRAKSYLANTLQDYHEGFWKWLHTDLKSEQTQAAISGSEGYSEVFFRSGRTILASDAWYRLVEKTAVPGGVMTKLPASAQPDESKAQELVTFLSNGPSIQERFESLLGGCAVVDAGQSDPTEDAEQFNLVGLRPSGEEDAEEHMRGIEPRLRKLRYRKLPKMSAPMIYAELDGISEFIPTTQLGQAFARILRIYCQLRKDDSKSVLLIDEIENGIYWQNLLPFWNGLLNLLTTEEAQLFATTHSFECMKAAHQAACERADKNGGTYDLNIIRLDRVDWGIKATEFGRETMEVAIAKGWEMR